MMSHLRVLGVGVVFVVVWQLVAATWGATSGVVPSPAEVVGAAAVMAPDPLVWRALGRTVLVAAGGLACALLLAVLVGIACGRWTFLGRSTWLPIEILKPIPPAVIMPLAILVLGPSSTMSFVLVVLGCLWPILVQTIEGAKGVDPVSLSTGRVYGMHAVQRELHITLPMVSPSIMSGLRLAASVALIVAVVTELIGGAPGIGQTLLLYNNASEYAQMYAIVLVLGTIGALTSFVLARAERRYLHWHASVLSRAGQGA